MKKHFFLFFISLFSTFGYLDTEVESYVDTQHKEIFGFLNNNQELLEKDKDSFLEEFEIKLSKLIPPSEISKRVMGKKFFNRASKKQIQNFNEKFKKTLLDSYSGALQNIEGSNIVIDSHFHPNERMDLAVVLSLIHISEPTRRTTISYAVFCLKKIKIVFLKNLKSNYQS